MFRKNFGYGKIFRIKSIVGSLHMTSIQRLVAFLYCHFFTQKLGEFFMKTICGISCCRPVLIRQLCCITEYCWGHY